MVGLRMASEFYLRYQTGGNCRDRMMRSTRQATRQAPPAWNWKRRWEAAALVLSLWCFSGLVTVGFCVAFQSSAPRKIFFYSNIGGLLTSASREQSFLIRPHTLFLTEDGSEALIRLHWRHWGRARAQGTGLLSTSNCTPSCATGARSAFAARIALSQPGEVFGRTVYQCFHVTVSDHPRKRMRECLRRHGSLYLYTPLAARALATPPCTRAPRPTDRRCGISQRVTPYDQTAAIHRRVRLAAAITMAIFRWLTGPPRTATMQAHDASLSGSERATVPQRRAPHPVVPRHGNHAPRNPTGLFMVGPSYRNFHAAILFGAAVDGAAR